MGLILKIKRLQCPIFNICHKKLENIFIIIENLYSRYSCWEGDPANEALTEQNHMWLAGEPVFHLPGPGPLHHLPGEAPQREAGRASRKWGRL